MVAKQDDVRNRKQQRPTAVPTDQRLVVLKPTVAPAHYSPPIALPKPGLLRHYLSTIEERLHMRIERRRAAAALPTLRLLTEQAKLAAEYQNSINAMRVSELEREVKTAELLQKKSDLTSQRTQSDKLANARFQRERLALQVEIAALRRQVREQRNPAQAVTTAAERRLQRKREIEQQIERLRAEETQALKPGTSELEQRRIKNMYSARRDELMEQLEEFL